MNTSIIARHEEIHESLRHLVLAATRSDIRANFAGAALLPEGDSRWIDQDEIRSERLDAKGTDFYVVRVYDLRTGEHMFKGQRAPERWYQEQLGDWYNNLSRWGRLFPNTYVVNGDYLFVSGGAWVITGMPNDGSDEVEFTSMSSIEAESRAEAEQERSKWLARHAENIAKVRPAWADPDLTWVDVLRMDDEGEIDPDLIEFRRDVGGVAIEQSCHVDDGVLTLQGEPQIRVIDSLDDHSVFSLEAAENVSFDAFAAASMVRGNPLDGEATVTDLFRVAQTFGITPSAVLALDESNLSSCDLAAAKLRRAADLLEEVAALEASVETDEHTFADAIRPHLVRIGVVLGDISAEDVAAASGVTR